MTRTQLNGSIRILALGCLALAAACDKSPVETPRPVATVEVSTPTPSLAAGDSARLVVGLKDAAGNALSGRTVEWSSSNTQIARVSSAGMVTGVSQGTVTISARSEGRQGAVTLGITTPGTPLPEVGWMHLWPEQMTLRVPMDMDYQVQARGPNGELLTGFPVTWTSSDTTVATVSASGKVVAKKPGAAEIRVTIGNTTRVSPLTVTPDWRFRHSISLDAALPDGLRVVVSLRGDLQVVHSQINGAEVVVGSNTLHYESIRYHHPDPSCSVQVVSTHNGGSWVELRADNPRAPGKLAGGLFPARHNRPYEVLRTQCAGQAPVTAEHTHVYGLLNALFEAELITDFQADANGQRVTGYDRTVTTPAGTIREVSTYRLLH